MSWEDFRSLIQSDPQQAVRLASTYVSSCSDMLKELHDDPDLDESDWLCQEGAILDEVDLGHRKPPDDFDVVYPDLDGIPSVDLRIGEFFHYMPLPHAIELVTGHFEVAAQVLEEAQFVIARGATKHGDYLWSVFDEAIAQLKQLANPNLPELTPIKDTVYSNKP